MSQEFVDIIQCFKTITKDANAVNCHTFMEVSQFIDLCRYIFIIFILSEPPFVYCINLHSLVVSQHSTFTHH